MSEIRKLAAILVADLVGYSRLMGIDEEGTLARLRALRTDFFSPTVAIHNGRVVKRTGDGAIVEFRSVVEAVRCAMEVQSGMVERNADAPDEKRIEYRVGIHLGDVVEEADGDLMGDEVNVAARLESICQPGRICLSEDAYRQVRDKVNATFVDLGEQNLKNISRPHRAYSLAPRGEGRSAVAPANVIPKRHEQGQRRAAIDGAVVGVLDNVARLIGAYAVKSRMVAHPAIQSAADISSPTPRPRDTRLRDRRWRRTLIVSALILLAAARAWRGRDSSTPPPATPPVAAVTVDKLTRARRLSIVVMPFADPSGDAKREADGLSDNLATDLTHLPDSFVIGRSAAASDTGKPVDPKQLGRDLGVRYALEGSVRLVGETIAVNAQLISTETGADVWAGRLEGERSRLGELQAELVSRLAKFLVVP